MTNLEILQGSAGLNYPIDEAAYKVALAKNNIDPEAEFSSTNQRGVDLAISDLALTLIFSVKSISDDGFSLTLQDVDALWRLRSYWRGIWGLPDDTPVKWDGKLKDATFRW